MILSDVVIINYNYFRMNKNPTDRLRVDTLSRDRGRCLSDMKSAVRGKSKQALAGLIVPRHPGSKR